MDYRDGDFYDWHLDLGRQAPSRKLSASVMLSSPEDYEGGALTFPGAEFDRVARGGAVVFSSFLLHGVSPCNEAGAVRYGIPGSEPERALSTSEPWLIGYILVSHLTFAALGAPTRQD